MTTAFYASILAILYYKMSLDTIRRTKGISLGIGPHKEIETLVSAHNNFASYVPLLLILSYFLEVTGVLPIFVTHIICCIFVVGRVLHYSAFKSSKMNFKWRRIGMMMTLGPTMVLSLLNIFAFIKINFL